MPTWITLLFVALLVVSLVGLILSRRGHTFRGPGTGAAGFSQGTLTITGLGRDDAPDKNGQRYCTLAGTILGPDIEPTEVYGTRILAADDPTPHVGQDVPVVYRPAKVSSTWQFGSLPD